MILSDIFDKQLIKLNLESGTKEAVFEELIEAIAVVHSHLDREEMLDAIYAREHKLNTSIMSGVAVPHGYYSGISGVIGAIGISRGGIEYNTSDHNPVHVVFLLVMSEGVRETHLRVLSKILALLNSGVLTDIQAAKTPQEVYDTLCDFQ